MIWSFRRRVVVAAFVTLVLATHSVQPLSAHPTATSFVEIRVTGSTNVRVALTTDTRALILKLQALSGASLENVDNAELGAEDARIRALMPALLERVELVADGERVPLVLEGLAHPSDRQNLVQIALSGTIARTARALVWRTSLFMGSYPLSVASGDRATGSQADDYEWLAGSTPSRAYDLTALDARTNQWLQFGRLVATGFTHIVPGGLDHMLFVLGLFLLAAGTRSLLLQITAFTVAHSVSLGLAATGFVSIPGAIVEPLIAASIVYVAIENVMTSRLSRWRIAIVFSFGLLHGLGFAGALTDLGFDRAHMTTTLVGFNVGVELGQLAVVAVAAAIVRMLPVSHERRRGLVTVPASVAIAIIGAFWALERL